MTDITQKERCTRGCIWLGAGVGLAAILMFWLIAGWGIILSVAAGAILGGIAAFVFTLIFCSKDADAMAPRTVGAAEAGSAAGQASAASKPAAGSSAAAQPTATGQDTSAPNAKVASKAGDASISAPSAPHDASSSAVAEAAPARSADAAASTSDSTTASVPASAVTEVSAFSGMKPSKELKGQKELAERKGDYKYVAPASEKAAPKKAAAKTAAPKKAAPKKAANPETTAPAAFADIPAEGGGAVAEAKPETLTAARAGGPDDLKLISGVGPKLEQTLNELGFYHFDQVAKWGPSEIAWVDSRLRFKGRIQRDNWMAQAKILAEGGETEFSARKK
jgi:predicted flap endonuclease-1-like 5' DNA nuclease